MFRRKRGSSPKKSSVEDAVDRTFVQSGLNKKQGGKSSLRNDLTDISKQDLSSRIDDFTYFDRDPVDTIADGWPVQILCHGSVFQVPWNTQFTESSESLDIDASVGINQEEAIAAMISGETSSGWPY